MKRILTRWIVDLKLDGWVRITDLGTLPGRLKHSPHHPAATPLSSTALARLDPPLTSHPPCPNVGMTVALARSLARSLATDCVARLSFMFDAPDAELGAGIDGVDHTKYNPGLIRESMSDVIRNVRHFPAQFPPFSLV